MKEWSDEPVDVPQNISEVEFNAFKTTLNLSQQAEPIPLHERFLAKINSMSFEELDRRACEAPSSGIGPVLEEMIKNLTKEN